MSPRHARFAVSSIRKVSVATSVVRRPTTSSGLLPAPAREVSPCRRAWSRSRPRRHRVLEPCHSSLAGPRGRSPGPCSSCVGLAAPRSRIGRAGRGRGSLGPACPHGRTSSPYLEGALHPGQEGDADERLLLTPWQDRPTPSFKSPCRCCRGRRSGDARRALSRACPPGKRPSDGRPAGPAPPQSVASVALDLARTGPIGAGSVTDLVTGGKARGPFLRRKGPLTCGFSVAGAGFEPATSGL